MADRVNPTDILEELKKEQERETKINDPFSHNEEKTIFDEKDKLVEEKEDIELPVDQVSENEYKFREEEQVVTEEDFRELTVETAVTSEIKVAHKSLRRAILWALVLILSILFGATTIWDFTDGILNFIDSAFGDDKDGWEATRLFLIAFGRLFEAGLFIFFIIFSGVKLTVNMAPWSAYRKETEPARNSEKIAKLTKEREKLLDKLHKKGGEINLSEYQGADQNKKIASLSKNNSKISKEISKLNYSKGIKKKNNKEKSKDAE